MHMVFSNYKQYTCKYVPLNRTNCNTNCLIWKNNTIFAFVSESLANLNHVRVAGYIYTKWTTNFSFISVISLSLQSVLSVNSKMSEAVAAAQVVADVKAKTPKKKATAATKAVKKPADHPKYIEMVQQALASLKERGGSSRQAILKYIVKNFKVGTDESVVNTHVKIALRTGVKNASLKQSKGTGAAGSFRLGEEAKKPKAAKKAKAPAAAKKPAKAKPATGVKSPKKVVKKAATTAAAKKPKTDKPAKKTKADKPKKAVTPKKTVTKATAPKKAAATPKKAVKADKPKKAASPAKKVKPAAVKKVAAPKAKKAPASKKA